MEDYPEYWDISTQYEDESKESSRTFLQLYNLCLEPTLLEVLPYICKLLLINLIFRLVIQIKFLPNYFLHTLSIICGIAVFYCISTSIFYISLFILLCYILIILTYYLSRKNWPFYTGFLCTVYLILSEFWFPVPEVWSESRGMHMIATMKAISIGFDMKRGTLKSFPSAVEFAGYMFCPSNSIFGPWIPFSTYKAVFTSHSPIFIFSWLKRVIISTLKSIIFLSLSNCWAYYLIPHNLKWFTAFQEAFAFRSSHYFISYLSEAAMLAAGFGYLNIKKKKESSWGFEISRPLAIELPRSLVQVVVLWNIPMHMWLKTYVFSICKPMGSFFAVIMTYVISSILHGFNIKLAAVLLSLGFYTYIEYEFRHKLSIIFDACIGANQCKNCVHTYKNSKYVTVTNLMFSTIAVFHLAYLGCLLDSTSDTLSYENETLGDVFLKWQHLDFASPLFTLLLYVIYKLI